MNHVIKSSYEGNNLHKHTENYIIVGVKETKCNEYQNTIRFHYLHFVAF